MGRVNQTLATNEIGGSPRLTPGGFTFVLKPLSHQFAALVPRGPLAGFMASVLVSNKSKWHWFSGDHLFMRDEKVLPPWRIYRWPWRFEHDLMFWHELYKWLGSMSILSLLSHARADAFFVCEGRLIRARVYLKWPFHEYLGLFDDLLSLLPKVEGLGRVKDALMHADKSARPTSR